MKKSHVNKLIVALLLAAASPVWGQQQGAFWNLEASPREYRHTIIRYYASNKRLIGEERVAKWIDIRKPRNVRKLNKKLAERLWMDSLTRVTAVRKKE